MSVEQFVVRHTRATRRAFIENEDTPSALNQVVEALSSDERTGVIWLAINDVDQGGLEFFRSSEADVDRTSLRARHARCPIIRHAQDMAGAVVVEHGALDSSACPHHHPAADGRYEVVAPVLIGDHIGGSIGVWFRDSGIDRDTTRLGVDEIAFEIGQQLNARVFESDRNMLVSLADARRREIEELYKRAPVGILETALDGKVLDGNHAVATMFGYSSFPDFQARVPNVRDGLYVSSSDRVRVVSELQATGVVRGATAKARRGDGSELWMEIWARVHQLGPDRRPRILSYLHDVTDRERAVDQIRRDAQIQSDLLREIHHRVRNNLAVVAAMMRVEQGQVDEGLSATAAFARSLRRIDVMAAVQELMFSSDETQTVRLDEIASRVVSVWRASIPQHVASGAPRLHLMPIVCGADIGTPFGLLIDALLDPLSSVPAHLAITLREVSGRVVLSITAPDPGGHRSLALDNDVMLQALVGQLAAQRSIVTDDRIVRVDISFGLSPSSPLLHDFSPRGG